MTLIKKLLIVTFFLVLPFCFAINSYSQELVTNGGFESGNSNGWSVSADGPGDNTCSYYVYSGDKIPGSGNSVEVPPVGNFAASSDSIDPPCTSAISQEIAVPAGAKVSCSLIYYYNNTGGEFINGPGLDSSDVNTANQQARIDIMAENSGTFGTGNGVLKNLFQTKPGDAFIVDYTTLNFSLTEYAGTTVIIRSAQASNRGDFLFAIDAVSCTVEDELGDGVSSIPTLSEWGLIAMAGILGIVGFIAMSRRKAVT